MELNRITPDAGRTCFGSLSLFGDALTTQLRAVEISSLSLNDPDVWTSESLASLVYRLKSGEFSLSSTEDAAVEDGGDQSGVGSISPVEPPHRCS